MFYSEVEASSGWCLAARRCGSHAAAADAVLFVFVGRVSLNESAGHAEGWMIRCVRTSVFSVCVCACGIPVYRTYLCVSLLRLVSRAA